MKLSKIPIVNHHEVSPQCCPILLSTHPVTDFPRPVNIKFTSDHVLSSDSDVDGSLPPLPSSIYLDSASVTPDLGSKSTNSSIVSQPQPDVTSSLPRVPEGNGTSPTTYRPDLGSTPSPCSGYKFVIDNIDMGVKPRYQRADSQNQSLHYVQVFAVKNRVGFSQL